MDGCRKAPIMTIGINPNLAAFLPGALNAACCYPSFSDSGGADGATKYAYYYRYRSVFQERFDLAFIQPFLAPEGRIIARKPGVIVSVPRPDDAPNYSISVRYDGDTGDTAITLPGQTGQPGYVLLFDPAPPHNRFKAGDLIAARLLVPAGQTTDLYAQPFGYYQRMRPVLDIFEQHLSASGGLSVRLRIGEDVGQLDMVGCASPHWGPQWLGGSTSDVQTIISNCVSTNAWALRQLIHTRPAVLILVGEASWNMFRYAFGSFVSRNPSLPDRPEDGAFTLLRATVDNRHPCHFSFSTLVGGVPYSISTRLIVSPHFSYANNFAPQFRLSAQDWAQLQRDDSACADFLLHDPRLSHALATQPQEFTAFQILTDKPGVLADLQQWPIALQILNAGFYDATAMLAGVLADLHMNGELVVETAPSIAPRLKRSEGACAFCVNARWSFPQGCPYGKTHEPQPAAGFLNQVAAEIAGAGAGAKPSIAIERMVDNGFEARRDRPWPNDERR
jgi:hypothetical protein